MIIRGKIVYVYDIEVFQNIFHCSVKNTETNDIYKFEISERKNQLRELVKFFKQVDKYITWGDYYTTNINIPANVIFCGYNNLHYDNPIINYIIEYEDKLMQYNIPTICSSIFNLSKTITTSSEDNIDAWKHWKYQIWFDTFDILTMLYSNKLRVGLKEIQVTMQYPNVQEFVCDWTKPLPLEDFDSMIDYNINDIESTSELLNRCKKDVDLRIAIEDEYGVRVLSKDGVNIGMKILTQKYLEKTGLTWWDIKDLRSPMSVIPLKDVILPFIKFNDAKLQALLENMKNITVSPERKGFEQSVLYSGTVYNIGVGGIHSKDEAGIITPTDDEFLIDCDVASLYPSLILEHKFVPRHLGDAFLSIYQAVKTERITAKRAGEKLKDLTLKLALNGVTGNYQNAHSWVYDPFAVMQIKLVC